jgi:hypothetical protein
MKEDKLKELLTIIIKDVYGLSPDFKRIMLNQLNEIFEDKI